MQLSDEYSFSPIGYQAKRRSSNLSWHTRQLAPLTGVTADTYAQTDILRLLSRSLKMPAS